jgi:hypothetical protein
MKSVCSNCGGELMHGDALGACSRCGHALTGALWTLEPPSRRRIIARSGAGARSRLFLQIAAGMLAGGVASFILFGLIEAEREASRAQPSISTSQQSLRPAAATGLSPGKNAPAVRAVSGGAALLHANAPARPLGALANADGGGSPVR